MTQDQKPPADEGQTEWIGMGIALGAGLGVVIGIYMDSMAIGIMIGAGLGVIFGAVMTNRNEDSAKEE